MLRTGIRCLLLAALALAALSAPSAPAFAASKSGTTASSKSKNTLRQFTGVVTALDAKSLTVEKGGKQAAKRTFTRHEEMRVEGDLERDARVTVYYREDGGKFVARRVVVKEADGESASR